VNDFFVVPCLLDTDQYPESRVTIYNQWGDEVYRSGMPYPSDWDGTYQGSELPAATYFYTIDYGTAQKGASGAVRIER
jgi:gliding motility-associated-like protein